MKLQVWDENFLKLSFWEIFPPTVDHEPFKAVNLINDFRANILK